MNWFLLAVLAQIILGSSAVFDKLLISRRSIEPIAYTFWLGMLGGIMVVVLPFVSVAVTLKTLLLALVAGAFFVTALFFLFWALSKSKVSAVFPLIGVLSPVFTFYFSGVSGGGGQTLGFVHGTSFLLFIFAGAILFITEREHTRFYTLCGGLMGALFFAGSVVISKIVFASTSFIAGFFWMKFGGVLLVSSFLLIPQARAKILRVSAKTQLRAKIWYFVNRAYAAIGSLLVYLTISLAPNAALVDATQNIKFLVVFLFARFIGQERFYGSEFWWKASAVLCIVLGFLGGAAGEYTRNLTPVNEDRSITWGITFSAKFAEQLGLNWEKAYEDILTELKPRKIRLIAYWDRIEKSHGRYDFSELDFQLALARERNSEVILAIGMKVPRWPECHIPLWAEFLPVAKREESLRTYLRALVERYIAREEIKMWQVENEPYLWFGECPERGENFLKNEIELVKSLDARKPVLTTDGGEFGGWIKSARAGDYFGTTIYRKVYPKFIGPVLGTVEYPLEPEYFRMKEKIIRAISGDFHKKFIVIELQAEPWGDKNISELSYEEQIKLFSTEYFNKTIDYAKKTGFEEYYLWGAEWWYLLKNKYKNPYYFDFAKLLISQDAL